MNYNKITDAIIEKFSSIVGNENLILTPEKMFDYAHDESLNKDLYYPELVVKPKSVLELSEILKICNSERIPVTARGAGTGLSGGAVPIYKGVLISFENMNRIIEIDEENMTAKVESGVRLIDLYKKTESYNLFFPPHPGDESATFGGMIATNASGSRTLKYGSIRNFVREIEFVLPDGTILKTGGKFIKNSTGYNLLNLLIGSEGTLALFTNVTLSLMPLPNFIWTIIVSFSNFQSLAKTTFQILKNGVLPLAAEFIDKKVINVSANYFNKSFPIKNGEFFLIIMLDSNFESEILNLAEIINKIALDNNAIEVLIADTKKKQEEVMQIRNNSYEALKKYMIEAFDISLPRNVVINYLEKIGKLEQKYNIWLPTYGHIGDGNIHTHIMKADFSNGTWYEKDFTKSEIEFIKDEIYNIGKELGGIVSGEHGIGFLKKKYFKIYLNENLINLMKSIKLIFDPNLILNPGKIF